MKSHLITGGSGYLGHLIAQRLLAKGARVRVLDLWRDKTFDPEIEFIEGSVLDREKVKRALEGIDCVHHAAALVPITKANSRFNEVNEHGSRVVAEESAAAAVSAFVQISSSAVYGVPKRCPVDARTPTTPIEPYGVSKLAGENRAREALESSRTRLLIVRPRTIISRGRLGLFRILFEQIKKNRPVVVLDGGNARFQFIHPDDLLDGYMLALESGMRGVLNVGCERFGTLRELLLELIGFAGSSSRVISLPSAPVIAGLRFVDAIDFLGLNPLAPWHFLGYHRDFHCDIEPLLKLGWRPAYSNTDMFREAYAWFLSSGKNPDPGETSRHRR